MKAMVQWQSEVCFLARSETGHQLLLDGPEEAGGQNKGPRPMELVLMGLGGCASYDVVSILKKARQKVLDCKVELSADRAEATPAVFTKIHLHFVIQGEGISEQHVGRAVQLSAEKYCSASKMLEAGGVEITHSFEIQAVSI
ncbi:OsmC family protein [bacterium]|jgi:putative redox protein|nr:OsmC family protein [Pseudomonadales bacterium]MDC3304531.1 OsmC family protein [bacterium]MDC3328957.1 OsmC family protein [Pseudomonadales bacterium]MDO7572634.1 OsmC family protein [Pseudomonadales bacterium]